jgi:hypothetical protein
MFRAWGVEYASTTNSAGPLHIQDESHPLFVTKFSSAKKGVSDKGVLVNEDKKSPSPPRIVVIDDNLLLEKILSEVPFMRCLDEKYACGVNKKTPSTEGISIELLRYETDREKRDRVEAEVVTNTAIPTGHKFAIIPNPYSSSKDNALYICAHWPPLSSPQDWIGDYLKEDRANDFRVMRGVISILEDTHKLSEMDLSAQDTQTLLATWFLGVYQKTLAHDKESALRENLYSFAGQYQEILSNPVLKLK